MKFENGTIIFDEEDFKYLKEEVFITRGCPSCDRPFYNESPKKSIYNFPDTSLVFLNEIKKNLINHNIY